ncbi:MAG: DUF4331 domain-containing protein [Gemmatimonadota bacterium]|nr:DUF4331 domain-containing protein [Gemmatimonadota bacterium]
MKRWFNRRDRLVPLIALGAVAAAVTAGSVIVRASDHQQTVFTEVNQRYDITDVYAFPAATAGRIALVLATGSPLTPAQTPSHVFGNISEELYQIKIDRTGDAVEDLVFQIIFTGPNNAQIVTVRGPVVPATTGTSNTLLGTGGLVVTGPTNTILGSPTEMQVFAGPRDDPFWIDLEQFFRIIPDRKPAFGPLSEIPDTPTASSFRPVGEAVDFLAGVNAQVIVIELPTALLTGDGVHGHASFPRFGVWATTSRINAGLL